MEEVTLSDLVPYIDWTPFFRTWELAGSYPKILDDDVVGEQAKALFADAEKMLADVIENKLLKKCYSEILVELKFSLFLTCFKDFVD